MPENLMNSAHKSNSDLYRKEWERIFKDKDSLIVGRIYPFMSPFGGRASRIIFNNKDYGVVAVNTHKGNKDA